MHYSKKILSRISQFLSHDIFRLPLTSILAFSLFTQSLYGLIKWIGLKYELFLGQEDSQVYILFFPEAQSIQVFIVVSFILGLGFTFRQRWARKALAFWFVPAIMFYNIMYLSIGDELMGDMKLSDFTTKSFHINFSAFFKLSIYKALNIISALLFYLFPIIAFLFFLYSKQVNDELKKSLIPKNRRKIILSFDIRIIIGRTFQFWAFVGIMLCVGETLRFDHDSYQDNTSNSILALIVVIICVFLLGYGIIKRQSWARIILLLFMSMVFAFANLANIVDGLNSLFGHYYLDAIVALYSNIIIWSILGSIMLIFLNEKIKI